MPLVTSMLARPGASMGDAQVVAHASVDEPGALLARPGRALCAAAPFVRE
jgi:hypothetical protein